MAQERNIYIHCNLNLQILILFGRAILFHQPIAEGKAGATGPCTREILETLYPCGNHKFYREKTGILTLEFQRFGKFCFGQSTSLGAQPITWDAARRYCRTGMGGDLIEFSNWDFYQYVLSNLDREGRQIVWIGGRRWKDAEPFYWLDADRNNPIGRTNRGWGSGQPDVTVGKNCMAFHNRSGWRNDQCNARHQWMCQLLESDYTHGFQLNIRPRHLTRNYYLVGEKFTISCESRARDGIYLKIFAETGRIYTIYSNNSVFGRLKEIYINDKEVYAPVYRYLGPRCFAFYEMTLTFTGSFNLGQSRVECCHNIERDCLKEEITIKSEPQDPTVHSNHSTKTTDSYTGDLIYYLCQARLGKGETMTIVTNTNGQLWGEAHSMTDPAKASGARPGWLSRAKITVVSGRSVAMGGNFMTLNASFYATATIKTVKIGCYARDLFTYGVIDNAREGDLLSTWLTFDASIKAIVFRPVLKISGLPEPGSDGKMAVMACEDFNVTCLGHVSPLGSFQLTISTESGHFTWSKVEQSLPSWIQPTAETYEDPQFGPAVYLRLYMKTLVELSRANFTCIISEGQLPIKHTEGISLTLSQGSVPPILTSKLFGENATDYVHLTCSSQLGSGDTQTWEILDHLGNVYYWFVTKDKIPTEVSQISWVEVLYLNGTFDKSCGNCVLSMLKVRNRFKQTGATLTCHSYDVNKPFQSIYTAEQLSASYEMFGGGYTGDGEAEGFIFNNLELLVIALGGFVALLVLILLLWALCCRKGNDEDNDEDNQDDSDREREDEDSDRKSEAGRASETTCRTDSGDSKVSAKSPVSGTTTSSSNTVPTLKGTRSQSSVLKIPRLAKKSSSQRILHRSRWKSAVNNLHP